ncbi:unnamed protein product [Camellia sinensis]
MERLLNVYAPKFKTGGTFWPVVHSPTIFSLILTQIIAIGIFGLKKIPLASTFCVSLPVLTLIFNDYCRKRFLPIFQAYSAEKLYSNTEVKTISTKYALKMATIPDLNMDCEAIMDNLKFGSLGMICKSLLLHTSQPMTMPMRKDMDEDTPQWCKSIFRVLSVSFFNISLMESKLRSGTTLIVDRYSFSGVAFSSAKGLDFEWCKVFC